MTDQAYTAAITEMALYLLELLRNVDPTSVPLDASVDEKGRLMRGDGIEWGEFEKAVIEKSLELDVDPFMFMEDTTCIVMQRINQLKRKGEHIWKPTQQ